MHEELIAVLNQRDTSLDGLSEDQLREGVLRLFKFNFEDDAVAADDARIAAAKRIGKGKI